MAPAFNMYRRRAHAGVTADTDNIGSTRWGLQFGASLSRDPALANSFSIPCFHGNARVLRSITSSLASFGSVGNYCERNTSEARFSSPPRARGRARAFLGVEEANGVFEPRTRVRGDGRSDPRSWLRFALLHSKAKSFAASFVLLRL